MIGETLAHFKITAKLGEGGMGEVYRAEDTKLGREVAIKVLPESVAEDPERLARFEREARVLAALEHINIAGIYGLEEADGRQLLVMQLIEGDTVQERIARGPISVPQAMEMALQIANALEAAHEKGIIHRDLKPANIKITPEGQIKVLDFGLAKALEVENSESRPELTQSPTLTAQMTGAGVLLGTAAYMAPEQARGDAADRRADIWAFGVVLFEMLTGKMTYTGKTVSDTLAGVLRADPEWDELSSETPRAVRKLLERCLEKEKGDRLQAIGEARIVIQSYLADPDAAEVPRSGDVETQAGLSRYLPWGILALATLVFVVALWLLWPQPAPPGRVIKAAIPPPENSIYHLHSYTPGPAVISPDGTKIAFSARDEEGLIQLYVRPLNSSRAYALSGTERAQYPFWSPDSKWIGFFTLADTTLKKIDASGGPPITLCSAVDVKGASWGSEGIIVFAPEPAAPLHRVAAAGGESTPITEIDTQIHNSHRQPRFLPDGRHFLFVARVSDANDNSLMLGSLEGEAREILRTPSQAEYSQGRLLFVREQTLMAQPFDLGRLELTGEAVPVAEKILVMKAAAVAAFSVSDTGVLTYQSGEAAVGSTLEWRDRSGDLAGTLGDGASYRQAIVSPDGTLAAVTIEDLGPATYDIWLYELERNLRTRFTFDAGNDDYPVWSPDSQSLYFTSTRNGKSDIYRKAIGGVGEIELIYASDTDKIVTGVSPDGHSLLFSQSGESTKADIWLLPLEGESEPKILRQTEFEEDTAHISPDGRWLAYDSDESGLWQVYVTPFPGPGRRWQISSETGNYNSWSADGRSLYLHRDDGTLEVVQLELGEESLRVGAAEILFRTTAPTGGGPWFSLTPDTERFLIVPTTEQQADTLLNLVINWPAQLDSH